MGVYSRKRRSGLVWCICYQVEGRQVHAVIGPDKREAERELARRQKAIQSGTYEAAGPSGATSFGVWFSRWLDSRTNRAAHRDQSVGKRALTLQWLQPLRLDALTPRHMARAVRDLSAQDVSAGTVKVIWGMIRTSLRDAVIAGAIPSSPCVLPRSMLPSGAGVAREAFDGAEVLALLEDAKRSPCWLSLLTVLLYTGCREGEACGLTWGDLVPAEPMHAILVTKQWDGRPLKTARVVGEHARTVPLHPELARALDAWRTMWEAVMCRPPKPADRILLNAGSPTKEWTIWSVRKTMIAACQRLGIRYRSPHCLRHTAITHLRRGGARPDVVERITHNAQGTILDRYTHWQWEPLCEAMACLKYGATYGAAPKPAGFMLCQAPHRGANGERLGRFTAVSASCVPPGDPLKTGANRHTPPTYAARHTCGPIGWALPPVRVRRVK